MDRLLAVQSDGVEFPKGTHGTVLAVAAFQALQAESAADGWEWNPVAKMCIKITEIPAQWASRSGKESILGWHERTFCIL